MVRWVVVLTLIVGGSLLGGCTSMLAKIGDPDMDVLKRGAPRGRVDSEMGKPNEVHALEEGRYVAVYEIKLGAPKNVDAKGESMTYVGKGVGASLAAGVIKKSLNAVGDPKRAPVAIGAAAVGLTIWGVHEIAGTVREIQRLRRRKKHRLEVIYDDRHRLLTHEVLVLER